MSQMDVRPYRNWEVKDEFFITHTIGGNRMKASCHHRVDGACGGCYARLLTMLDDVVEFPEVAKQITAEVSAKLRAESK